jgi:hypothetical protein
MSRRRQSRKNTIFKTDSIIFFDDDFSGNIEPFREQYPGIKSIHISRVKPYTQILKGNADFYYPIMFSRKYRKNRYAREITKGDSSKRVKPIMCNQCEDYTTQGISIAQIKQVIKWANASPQKEHRMVLFDLDNTLAVCNLIMTTDYIKKANDGKFSVVEIAQYISGTKERFDALLLMFFNLRKNGVACKIFSNNGWSDKDFEGFPFFVKIMRVFDPQMTEDDIIYGHLDKAKTFSHNRSLLTPYYINEKKRVSSSSSKGTLANKTIRRRRRRRLVAK